MQQGTPPPRNRRSQRANAAPAPRQNAAAGMKSRKKHRLFSTGQLIFLCVLLAVFLFVLVSSLQAGARLDALQAQREKERLSWQQEIARHKVLYESDIRYHAAVNKIDPAFVAAIIKRESDYDPYAISSVQARGLMQIMPDTGEWLAGKVDVRDFTTDILYDGPTNIKMGCWYLGYLSRMFQGDPILVACAYHAGQNNVKGWVEKYSSNGVTLTLEEIPMENTRYYARKVLEAYAIYQQYHY